MSSERTANAVDAWLGQRMRARRQEIGITQERLADLMGITFQQVQKYERGVNRIAASRLYDVCKILDISVAELMEGYETERPSLGSSDKRVGQFLALPEAPDLLTSFIALRSPRMRRRFVELMRTFVTEQSASEQAKTP